MVRNEDKQVGILEKVTRCEYAEKWAEIVVSGKESSMKYGNLSYLCFHLPEVLWGGKYTSEVDAIAKLIPTWPEGARVKCCDGDVVAVWVPTKKLWLRTKVR